MKDLCSSIVVIVFILLGCGNDLNDALAEVKRLEELKAIEVAMLGYAVCKTA